MIVSPYMNWNIARQQDFTGGENRQLVPETISENQMMMAVNCLLSTEGVLETRLGKTALNTTIGAGGITSLHRYAQEDGDKYLVAQHGTALYAGAWNGTAASVTFASAATSLNAAAFSSVTWRNKLLLTNGVDYLKSYNGSAISNITAAPKSTWLAAYGGKLWIGDVTNPNHLRFSGLEDETTYDALDLIKVRDGDGDAIVNACPLNGGMVVLKTNSMWALYGTSRDDIQLSNAPIADNKGCYAPRSVVSLGDKGFCVGKDAFYLFTLTEAVKLPPTHDAILASLSDTEKRGAVATHNAVDNRIIVTFPDYYNTTISFELNYNAKFTWKGLNAKSLATAGAAGDTQQILVGDKDNGIVYILNNDADDAGADISTEIWTPYRDFSTVREKVFRWYRPEFSVLANFTKVANLYYDIDQKNKVGFTSINETIKAVLRWGETDWAEGAWGPIPLVDEYLHMHTAQGMRGAFGLKVPGRIRFTGYSLKYREVGAI